MFHPSIETFHGNLSICIKFTWNCHKNKSGFCVWTCMNKRGRQRGRQGEREGGSWVYSPGWRVLRLKTLFWVLKSTDVYLDFLSTGISWNFHKKSWKDPNCSNIKFPYKLQFSYIFFSKAAIIFPYCIHHSIL